MPFEGCCAPCQAGNPSPPTGCDRTILWAGAGGCMGDCSSPTNNCTPHSTGSSTCDPCCSVCDPVQHAICTAEFPPYSTPIITNCLRRYSAPWSMQATFVLGFPRSNPQVYSTLGQFDRDSLPSPSLYNRALGNGLGQMSNIKATMGGTQGQFTNTSSFGSALGFTCGVPCSRDYGDPVVGQSCTAKHCGHPLCSSSFA